MGGWLWPRASGQGQWASEWGIRVGPGLEPGSLSPQVRAPCACYDSPAKFTHGYTTVLCRPQEGWPMFPRRSRLQRVSSTQGPSPPTLGPLIALDM